MEYIILYIIALFPVFHFELRNEIDNKNRYLIFEWVAVVCLMGFRYHVGGDSFSYEHLYDKYPTITNISSFNFADDRYAWLWNLFCIICKTISNEFWVQQLLVCIFVNVSFFRFFKLHTDRYFLAIFIYLFLYMFKYNTEVLRASMAVATFLFSYDYLISKKWIYYYILCLIAYGFHHEAIILFALPLIHLIEKMKLNAITFGGILAVVFVLTTSLSMFTFFQNVFAYDEGIVIKLEEHSSYLDNNISFNGFLYYMVTYYLPVCILLWFRRDIKDYQNPFLILFLTTRLMSFRWSHITGRMEDFFIIILIATFVNTISKIDSIYKRNVILTSLIYFIVFTYINTTLHILPLVYPYHSIFYPIDEPDRELLFNLMLNNEI